MPTCHLSRDLAEMFTLLVVVIVVVNAFALMVRVASLGEILRNAIVSIRVLLALAALFGVLLDLWENLTLLEKIGVATVGVLLVYWKIRHRYIARKKDSR